MFELVLLFSYVSKTAVSAVILGGAGGRKRGEQQSASHTAALSQKGFSA